MFYDTSQEIAFDKCHIKNNNSQFSYGGYYEDKSIARSLSYGYTKITKLNFIKFADVAAPSILGRWGNFFNQEAHGDVVSYEFINHFPMFIQKGMNINGTYYNPTFLYESTWNILIFIILIY